MLDLAINHDGSGARVCASILASLYNGHRVKMDLTELRLIDYEYFEDAINVLRLDNTRRQEVHRYFENGGEISRR